MDCAGSIDVQVIWATSHFFFAKTCAHPSVPLSLSDEARSQMKKFAGNWCIYRLPLAYAGRPDKVGRCALWRFVKVSRLSVRGLQSQAKKNRDDLFCSLSRTYSTGICNFPLQKTNQRVISCPLKALSPRSPPSVAESGENAPNRNALSPVFWSFVARCHRAAQLEWLLVDDLIE